MARQRFTISIFMAAGTASLAWCAVGAAAVSLQLKLDKGKTYYQKTTVNQQMTQSVMGQQQTIEQGFGTGMKLEVLDVDSQGHARIQHTFTWLLSKQIGPMGTVEYDSSKHTTAPAGAEVFAALLGQTYVARVTPKGEVLEIEGADELREAVLKKLPPGANDDAALGAAVPYLDKKSLRETTENMLANYPEKAVEIGDSWNKKRALSMGFGVIVDSKYTLQKREAGTAVIGASSSLRSDPNAPPMTMGAMKLKFDVAGTQDSTIRMEEATGLVALEQARQQLKGEIHVLGESDQGPPMMSIPVTFDTTIKLETSDQPAAPAQ
jgi:hypothetical protein